MKAVFSIDTYGNKRISDQNSYEIAKTSIKLRGKVNKVCHKISFSKENNKMSNEYFEGDFEIDDYNSIGFFPNGEFKETKIYIREDQISSGKEGDYYEVFASTGIKPDDYGQHEFPSILMFTFFLSKVSYSKIREELIEKDSISNKKLEVDISLDSTGIYENFIAYMSGDHTSKGLIGSYYKILLKKNHVSNYEEMPDEFKSHEDSDYLKSMRNFIIRIITN